MAFKRKTLCILILPQICEHMHTHTHKKKKQPSDTFITMAICTENRAKMSFHSAL